MKRRIILSLISLVPFFSVYPESELSFSLTGEFGFTGIINHVIQNGTEDDKGDLFDYRTQGNQDILFPFSRFQAELASGRHHALLLYQPLTIETEAPIEEDFRYNQIDFSTADGFLNLIYGFDFWRLSYLYDLKTPPGYYLALGGSLQIRNASIRFETTVNGKGTVTDNIGPVPILKGRGGYEWDSGLFLEAEADGFYATNKIFNGASYAFTGYIYDLSVRMGYPFREDLQVFLNGRLLGGGAEGVNGDGQYTYNDLHTFDMTLGGRWLL